MNTYSGQTQRLFTYLQAHPDTDIDQPTLNRVCAGPGGVYVASWSKRASEVRKLARANGGDFVRVRDEWVKDGFGVKHRFTWYRYTPPCKYCADSDYSYSECPTAFCDKHLAGQVGVNCPP